jgi:hypothetical protein
MLQKNLNVDPPGTTTQESVATCRLESQRYVASAFQPAGWETFQSRLLETPRGATAHALGNLVPPLFLSIDG